MNYHGAEGLEFGNGNIKLDPAVLAGKMVSQFFNKPPLPPPFIYTGC
jgi:hypothetical protein